MKRHYVTSGVPFSLGRVGEHMAREIVFDLRRWKNLYGEGEAQLIVRRTGEKIMYSAPLDIEGDSAIWRVARTDTAVPGVDGECELRYILEDGTLAKSEIWTTSVQPSMNYEESAPPVEARPWMDTLNQHIDDVLNMKADIEKTAERAEEIAARTEDVAGEVQKAEEARDAADEYAQQAAASEDVAAQSAKNAAASVENAAKSENNAASSAEQAATSAESAENFAGKAAVSAEHAAGLVDRIENMAVDVVTLAPGSTATVENKSDDNALRMVLGLPEGLPGHTPVKGVDYFDGRDGEDGISVTHSWNGTELTLNSASGTSKIDLKGERGESGVTTPVNGFFTLSVDADGNLWAHSAESGSAPEFEYNSETGDLYIVQEV